MFWLDTVVMAMVLIGVIGFVLDYGLALAERRLQRWRVAGVAVEGHAVTVSRRVLRGLVLPALLLGAWEVLSHTHWVDPRILPPIEQVVRTAAQALTSGDLVFNLAVSLARDLAGFVGGTVIGLMAGTVLGLSRVVEILVPANLQRIAADRDPCLDSADRSVVRHGRHGEGGVHPALRPGARWC